MDRTANFPSDCAAEPRSLTVRVCNPGLGCVLVLDNDPKYRESACAALGRAGFEVEGLDDPRDVLEHVARFAPDTLVLDRHLPGDSGELIACRLRVYFGLNRPAVVFWTADPDRDMEAGLLSGIVDDVVVKGQQRIDVLVQRVIKETGWEYISDNLLLKREDGTVLYRGQRSRPLTARELDFLFQLVMQGSAGVSRGQAWMLLEEPGDGDSNKLFVNSVMSRFKAKLPPLLRAAFLRARGKGWYLKT